MTNPLCNIYIQVSESKTGLKMSSDSLSGYAGTQWDDNAQALVFKRDKTLEDLPLLLLFGTPDGQLEHLLGLENTYRIRNSITQYPSVTLQIAFIDGESYRYGANKLELRYRPADRNGAVPVAEESRLSALEGAAFAKVTQSGAKVTFLNSAGQSVGAFTASGSGGGGFDGADGKDGADGYTPIRGVDYWTPEDIAAIRSDNYTYIDSQLSTLSHNELEGRDAANAHPINAITGLPSLFDNTFTLIEGGDARTLAEAKAYTDSLVGDIETLLAAI